MRIFALDRDAVVEELRRRARALVAAEARVLEVRLFGSLARGSARPGSDADLLVTLRRSEAPFLERSAHFARYFTGAGIGCDIFAYTAAELDRLRAEANPIVRAAERDGIVLAARASTPAP